MEKTMENEVLKREDKYISGHFKVEELTISKFCNLEDYMFSILFLHKKYRNFNYYILIRWDRNPVCPYESCGHDKVFKYSNGKTYKCSCCQKQFSVRVGTIFEDSKVSLKKWFAAIYLVTSHKKGISSTQLAKDIGQFDLIPKLISRLFCYIDDKNNIWVSSGVVDMQFFGNLSISDSKTVINKRMMCSDLKAVRWEHPSDTLHHTSFFDIIENNEFNTLKYILRFNRPENMENLYVGYINIPNDYIFSETNIEDGYEDYDNYKIGCVITEKLYNNPISIEILGKIVNGEIITTPITAETIVMTNNSKNGL